MDRDTIASNELAEIVGERHVSTATTLDTLYSQDQIKNKPLTPFLVAFPENATEIQKIIKYANKHQIPVTPKSSKISLYGTSIPKNGGIMVDLKRMDRIVEIDKRNWYAIIEPGVTFLRLQRELKKYGFRAAVPLLEPPSASVIASYMERIPVVTAADFTYGAEHVVSYTIILPSGEEFTVGHPPLENTPASAPDGPGLNFYRIFQGAQGTLGIVTKMIIRLLPIPKAQKLFFIPCSGIDRAVKVVRRIQKQELGLECFILNNFTLSSVLLKETKEQKKRLNEGRFNRAYGDISWGKEQLLKFSDLQKQLPSWTVMISLSAVGPIPDEKISYQEKDLKEAMAEIDAQTETSLSEISEANEIILRELNLPLRTQKRLGYKSSCKQIVFCTAPDKVVESYAIATRLSRQFQYPDKDIGVYLLPLERARAFYCCFDFFFNAKDKDETARIQHLFEELCIAIMDAGAVFDRPYGEWAKLVYSRTGSYTKYLKKIKNTLDPNNIMNPGRLCF